MNSCFKGRREATVTAIAALVVLTWACGSGWDAYDPPPEATLVQPEGGAFLAGQPLEVAFSEPVDPTTISLRVWGDVRNVEKEIPPGEEPLEPECTIASSPCGDVTLTLSADEKRLEIAFAEEGLGQAGPPMILEVMKGLADVQGRSTGVSRFFDFQFRKPGRMNAEPVQVESGKYLFLSSVNEPLPYVIMLISDLRVLESGEMVLAGLDGNPIDGAAKNTDDPTEIVINENDTGWSVFLTGFVRLEGDQRLLETDPIDLTVPAGPITVSLQGVRMFAEITKDPETGKDRFDGTLSHTGLVISTPTRSTDYPAASTALQIEQIPEGDLPVGGPELCSDLCGLIVGLCEPPDDFPPAEFCE